MQGTNLTFGSTDSPISITNYLTVVQQAELQNATAQSICYYNNNQLAILTDSLTVQLYDYYLVYQSTIQIFQGELPMQCMNIVEVGDNLIVDCYTPNELVLYIIESQISIPIIQYPIVINSNTTTKLFYSMNYLYLGVFMGQNSQLLVFPCNLQGIPTQPINILNEDIWSNNTYVWMQDYVVHKYDIFMLNYTKNIIQYNMTNGTVQHVDQLLVFPDLIYLLGMQYIPDSQSINTLYFYVATTLEYVNILEYIYVDGYLMAYGMFQSPQLNNSRVNIQLSNSYAIIQQGQMQVYLQRGQSRLSVSKIDTILQSYLFSRNVQQVVYLNPIFETVLFGDSTLVVQYLGNAKLTGYFNTSTNGQFTVYAISQVGEKIGQCQILLNYTVLLANDPNLYPTTQYTILPTTSLYPTSLELNLNNMFCGPLIDAEGIVLTGQSSSYFEQSTLTPTPVKLQNYPPPNVTYGKNLFNTDTYTLVQLLVQNTAIYAYFCEGTTTLYCDNMFLNIDAQHPVTDIQMAFSSGDKFVYAINQQQSSIYVYECSFNKSSETTNNTLLGVIPLLINGVLYNYTSFTLINNRLYVVIASLNQIWVCNIYDMYTEYGVISTLDFEFPFTPIQVVGYQELFNHVVFINNQYSFIIINYKHFNVQLITHQLYPIEASTQLNLIQYNLIATQLNGTTQLITQWNVYNLLQPIWIKVFPIVATIDATKPVVSDQLFLYVFTNLDVYMYNPMQSQHNCLFQQFRLQFEFFSPSSSYLITHILYGTQNSIYNLQMLPNPTLTFIPGYYSTAYETQISYQITVNNTIGTNNYNITQNMTVFNSQLGITVNQTEFNQSNTGITLNKTNISIFPLNLSTSVSGGVATYAIECDWCSNVTKFQVTNYLQRGKQKIGDLPQVQQIENCPQLSSAFVQTLTGIYLVNQTFYVELLLNFTTPVEYCYSLSYNAIENTLLSICIITGRNLTVNSYTFVDNRQLVPNISYIMDGFNDIIKSTLIGSTLLILGVQQQEKLKLQQLIILNWKDNAFLFNHALLCAGTSVNDFTAAPLYNFTNNGIKYLQFAIFLTCSAPPQVTYVAAQYYNNTLVVNPRQMLIDQPSGYFLFPDTQFQQIIPIWLSYNNITLLLTTSNVMNFIFNLSYTPSDSTTNHVVFNAVQILHTIPPYGTFKQTNKASYVNGLLVLTSYHISEDSAYMNFLSVYNTNTIWQGALIDQPLLMIGGIYQASPETLFRQQFTILSPIDEGSATTIILVTDMIEQYNLGSILLKEQIDLIANISEPFGSKTITLFAENYFTKEALTIYLDYPILLESDGLPWWSWLVILLGVVLGGMCVTLFCQKFKQDDGEYSELEL